MSTMSEHNQSRKFADKSAAIANETVEKGKANRRAIGAGVRTKLFDRSRKYAGL